MKKTNGNFGTYAAGGAQAGFGGGAQTGAGCVNNPDISKQVENYAAMDEDALMREMLAAARARKMGGSLDNATLEGFYAQSAGMLTPSQQRRMRELIDMLKD